MQVQAPSATTSSWPRGAPAQAIHNSTRVELAWADGSTRSVNTTWLRDNCVCDDCRITQTGEHRYFLGQHEQIPAALAVALVAGALLIDWSDGHSSRFTPEDFARITHVAARAHHPVKLWTDDFMPERFQYDAVINDQATRDAFMVAVMRDGMTLITEMGSESSECLRFLEQLGVPIRDTPFDLLHDVYFHADGYNVAHTDEPLPPHNDFASYHWPPSGQLIHMLVNEVEGGDWVNVDGFRVLHQVNESTPEAIDVLARVPVAFREHSDTAESWARAPLVRRNSLGDIIGIRFSNQLMQPIDPCDPDLEDFYEAYHLLARTVNDPGNQIQFRGHGGTMQVLHAHRILHARRGFDGSSGSRHLQDTYFEFDDVRSLHALSTGEAR